MTAFSRNFHHNVFFGGLFADLNFKNFRYKLLLDFKRFLLMLKSPLNSISHVALATLYLTRYYALHVNKYFWKDCLSKLKCWRFVLRLFVELKNLASRSENLDGWFCSVFYFSICVSFPFEFGDFACAISSWQYLYNFVIKESFMVVKSVNSSICQGDSTQLQLIHLILISFEQSRTGTRLVTELKKWK